MKEYLRSYKTRGKKTGTATPASGGPPPLGGFGAGGDVGAAAAPAAGPHVHGRGGPPAPGGYPCTQGWTDGPTRQK